MTIREGTAGDPEQPKTGAADRVRRPATARTGPNRSGMAAPGASTAASAESDALRETTVSDAVAQAVKLGYDVIAENIRQGRQAAERFSKGKYNIREAPGDLEVAAQRLLHLARELSTTSFDVCERLLKELAAQKPAPDRAGAVPSFREPKPAPPPHNRTSSPPAEPAVMKVTVRFEGAPGAIAHTGSLPRPRTPTAPADVTAEPLAPSEAGAKPIANVAFEIDVSVEGIVARVSVPEGQPPGVYSGMVRVKGDPIPLGVLTIELPK